MEAVEGEDALALEALSARLMLAVVVIIESSSPSRSSGIPRARPRLERPLADADVLEPARERAFEWEFALALESGLDEELELDLRSIWFGRACDPILPLHRVLSMTPHSSISS